MPVSVPVSQRLLQVLGSLAAVIALAGGAAVAVAGEDARPPIPDTFYRPVHAVRVAGKAPDWDYLALDPARQRLFIARRGAGLWVFDTAHQRMLRRIARSEGAGAALLLPGLGRGFSTNEDGTTTVFDLASLAVIARVKFADDADAASYEPMSGRIAFVSGDSRVVTFMDPRSMKVTGRVSLAAEKADASAPDGAGHILLNERDRAMVAQIDPATSAITAEWPTTGCSQPTGLAVDTGHHRAFIGCRSTHPVLAVMDTTNGHVITTLDLGRGNDGVAYDAQRQRIITTNGVDGNIVIFHQDDADHYRLEQAVTTRPGARTLAYDPRRGTIFTVAAEGVVNPAAPVNTGPSPFYPNAYYDDSFTVLTYAAARGG